MNDEQAKLLIHAVQGHGDQLGDNLVLLKRFMQGLQKDQQQFLAEQRAASDTAQTRANRAALWSAVAAIAAALAAIVQAYVAVRPLINTPHTAQVLRSNHSVTTHNMPN